MRQCITVYYYVDGWACVCYEHLIVKIENHFVFDTECKLNLSANLHAVLNVAQKYVFFSMAVSRKNA